MQSELVQDTTSVCCQRLKNYQPANACANFTMVSTEGDELGVAKKHQ